MQQTIENTAKEMIKGMIAEQNDRIRASLGAYKGSRLVLSHEVSLLAEKNKLGFMKLLRKISGPKVFDLDNDPYGEHDFGSVKFQEKTFFWKIDYYGPGLDYWGDPLDQTTIKVLTIMSASEY